MRIQAVLATGLIVAVAACSHARYPAVGPTSSGSRGGNTDGTPQAGNVLVMVGNIFMKSQHNATINPAVDTAVAGGSVTWNGSGLTGDGRTYRVTFTSLPALTNTTVASMGTMMPGTIVVR